MNKPAYTINWDQQQSNHSELFTRAEVESMQVTYMNVIAQKSSEVDSLRAVIQQGSKDIPITHEKIGGISVGAILVIIFIIWLFK